MDYLTESNLTQRVIDTFSRCQNARLKEIMEKLVHHLHAFARDAELKREEWLYGVEYLRRAGAISDERRNEFMGLSDTLGLTSLVEFLSQIEDGSTPFNNLGPFYVEDAPQLAFNADLRGNQPGEPVLLRGHVLDSDSRPITGARINMWQTREDGLYDVQIPQLAGYFFRGWMETGRDGAFQVRTIKPKGYTAPMDGPLGEMLISTQRNEWRPAHWHFLIRAPGFQELVTELYPSDSPHVDDDVAFGPRRSLIVDLTKIKDGEEAKRLGMPMPFLVAEYNFTVARA
jgi:hydroxyquinol 1,2-dioxygenase